MTQKEKAKAYDEALKWMRIIYPSLSGADKEDAEHFFPELRESEDERIRKALIEVFKEKLERGFEWVEYGIPNRSVLSWLEKQKEQKPVQSDVEREYVRTLKSLISDFLRGKEDVDREYYQQIFDWLDGRHIEQKPVDFPTTDEEVNEFLETHSKVEVPEKYKTPDFVFSKQEYKSYPIISKDTTSVKPAEWSEEDEDMLNSCISSIEEAKENRYAYKETDGDTSCDHEIAWLKLLRNRVGKEFLQPHWKPSEKEITAFENMLKGEFPDGIFPGVTLSELLTKLKKLYYNEQIPYWKPSEEQMKALYSALNDANDAISLYSNKVFPLYEEISRKRFDTLESLYNDLKKLM